jgi:hypothetical protein
VADFSRGEEIDQELHRFDGDLGLGLFGAGPQVGRADDIGHAEQRALSAGLFDKNVESHAADFAALQPFDECCFVIDAAAGAVDEADAGLHDVELGEADEVGGFRREGRVDGEVIDVRQHVPHSFDPLDAELGRLFGGKERVKAEHPHLEGDGPLGDFLTDAAEADDAERFVGELRPHVRFAVPLAGEQAVVGGGDRAGEGEQEGEGVLRGAEGVAGRRVHHDDALAGGDFLIDVVGADAGPGDGPQAMVPRQRFAGDSHAAAADGPVEFGQSRFERITFQAGADLVLDARCGSEHFEAFFGDGVEDEDAGHGGGARGWGLGAGEERR